MRGFMADLNLTGQSTLAGQVQTRINQFRAAIPMSAYALDCSHKPPCPTGTTAQESVSCEACCADGYAITSATDKWCCPIGMHPTEDHFECVPNGAILKSDGSCWAMSETDPCCKEGWHSVNKYECCPDNMTLASDVEGCCTMREDGKCCPPLYLQHPTEGVCIPPKPTGVIVR